MGATTKTELETLAWKAIGTGVQVAPGPGGTVVIMVRAKREEGSPSATGKTVVTATTHGFLVTPLEGDLAGFKLNLSAGYKAG